MTVAELIEELEKIQDKTKTIVVCGFPRKVETARIVVKEEGEKICILTDIHTH